MKVDYRFYLLIIILLIPGYGCASISPVEKISFDANFEYKSYKGYESKNIVDGVVGKGIKINNNCLEVPIQKLKNKGTISFWVKPDWGYYDNRDSVLTSHTFLSMRWTNGGYLAFSDGWWEDKGGALNTYFIFNNKDLLNVHSKIKFKKNKWLHLAVTWNSISNQIKMFHNGSLVASKTKKYTLTESSDVLYLGCDKGAFSSESRYLNGIIDELEIYDIDLSEDEIFERFRILDIKTNHLRNKYSNVSPGRKSSNIGEIRAVFDSYPASWQTKAQAEATIRNLYESGINVYIPCVWYGDGARYDSNVAPHAVYKGDGKPLKYLIEIAHKYGIEVHPWITVTYRSSDFLSEFYDKGTPPNAFEVHKQSFRDFIISIAHELITQYDIDGLNLDYIRTMGVSKSHFVLNKFENKYKKTLHSQLKKLDSMQNWPAELQEFINEPIDEMVIRISRIREKYKPDIIISVDGHPEPLFMGESRQGRNELKWLNSGLIDIVFAMEYSESIDYEKIDLVKKDAIDPSRVIVLIGTLNKAKPATPRSVEQVEKLIVFSRNRWNNGIALYPYYLMTDELHSSLAGGLFSIWSKPEWPR